MAYVWVTFIFLSTIPFLAVFVAISFYIMFWVDKIMLLRFYRTPKDYNEQNIFYTISRLKWTILIHAAMGMFFLSNMNILSQRSQFGEDSEKAEPEEVSTEDDYYGDDNSYAKTWNGGELLIGERYTLPHMWFWYIFMIMFVCFVIFENVLQKLLLKICLPLRENFVESYDAISVACADLYDEMNPVYLVKEYQKTI